jgi:hypothetical protein
MSSSRSNKGVTDYRHIRLCKCIHERTMWHSHIGTVKGMQRARPYRLGINLHYPYSVAK